MAKAKSDTPEETKVDNQGLLPASQELTLERICKKNAYTNIKSARAAYKRLGFSFPRLEEAIAKAAAGDAKMSDVVDEMLGAA